MSRINSNCRLTPKTFLKQKFEKYISDVRKSMKVTLPNINVGIL